VRHIRRYLSVTALTAGAVAVVATGSAPAKNGGSESSAASTGPSSKIAPYVIPAADGVRTKSLITVDGVLGDGGAASNGYELTGIPDGLGAFSLSGNRVRLFANHELGNTVGAVRRHGQAGAFVSAWTINRRTFEVEEGSDLIDPGTQYWNYPEQKYQSDPSPGGDNPRTFGTEVPNIPNDDFIAQNAAFNRFCSNNLTELGQLYNRRTGRGYNGRMFFPNEEGGNESRVFGTLENGTTKQLPRLGLFSWENTVAAHNRSDTTLVMGNEDTAEGQVWAYVGSKRRVGDAFDRAGLTNGANFAIDLENEAVGTDAEFRTEYGKDQPARFDLSEVDWDQSGAAQNAEAKAEALTLNRVEDGVWDPSEPNTYYFVTTEGGDKAPDPDDPLASRDGGGLWKLTFEDIERPQDGGTLELLLDGSEAPYLNKPDNLGLDERGNLLIQEDPGGNPHVARIVAYDIDDGDRGVVATFDPELFAPATPGGTDAVLTTDEESSGIIDARHTFGSGWWLFDAQVHRRIDDPTRVEEGQLLALHVDDWDDVYTIDG
jgi:Bacterial protein of unknown function (DUF839)